MASLSLLLEVLSAVDITIQNDLNLNKLIKKVSGIASVKGILKIAYLYQLSTQVKEDIKNLEWISKTA